MHPSASQVIALYERHAQAWDRDRRTSLFERPWLDRFRATMGTARSILDLGCGMGQPIARYFIDHAHEVTGVDSSPSLIALCTARFPGQSWIVGDMRTLELGVRFGGLLAWDSFFHLAHDDQRAMFPIFRAHAAAGAVLMFTSGPEHGEGIGSYEGEALYHASLAPDEYVALLSAHGFAVLHHVVEDPACGGRTVWLARAK